MLEKYVDIINKVELIENDNIINIHFEDSKLIQIQDAGQDCCEERYITCDDNLDDLIGNKFLGVNIKEVKEEEYGIDSHDIMFLEILTNKNSINFCTHNEHNGYYGGFNIKITELNNIIQLPSKYKGKLLTNIYNNKNELYLEFKDLPTLKLANNHNDSLFKLEGNLIDTNKVNLLIRDIKIQNRLVEENLIYEIKIEFIGIHYHSTILTIPLHKDLDLGFRIEQI